MRTPWAAALLVALLAAPAGAESFRWYAGVEGLALGDLDDLTLLDTSTTTPTVLADPGITLTPIASAPLWYTFSALPDAEPGSGDSYALAFRHQGIPYSVEWPLVAQSLQPQAVSFQLGFMPIAGRLELGAGDLLPFAEANVSGLTSDPTGATVTFTLVDSAGAEVLDGVAAELASASSYLGTDGAIRWRALLRYRWAAGDTDDAGEYTYSFRIVFPGSPPRPLTIPPPRTWNARIY